MFYFVFSKQAYTFWVGMEVRYLLFALDATHLVLIVRLNPSEVHYVMLGVRLTARKDEHFSKEIITCNISGAVISWSCTIFSESVM